MEKEVALGKDLRAGFSCPVRSKPRRDVAAAAA